MDGDLPERSGDAGARASRSGASVGRRRAAARSGTSRCLRRRRSTRRGSSWLSGGVLESMEGLLDRHRLAVGPGRGHRAERVGHGQDPGDQRDLLARTGRQVAVGRPSARGGGGRRPGRGSTLGTSRTIESPRATCCLTIAYSSSVSGARLAQDRRRGCRSCRRRGAGRRSRASRRRSGIEAELVGQEQAVAGDVLGVALGVAVLGVDGQDQARPGRRSSSARPGPRLSDAASATRIAVAAAGLGLTEDDRGDRQQLGRGVAVGRGVADAGADGDRQALGGPELEAEVGDRSRSRSIADSRSATAARAGDDQELVGAVAAEDRRVSATRRAGSGRPRAGPGRRPGGRGCR